MVKVTLHGDLGDQIGSEWNLKVNSVSEAIRAIEANTGKLIKYLIQQAQNEAKYEIFINNRSVWVPNVESLPQKNKDLTKKHIDSLRNSELNMPFENDKLSSIDIIPVIEGAGGGGGGGGGGCFPAGIKISTPNGYKNIENFKAGDEILCFDKDKNIKTSVVEETFFHENNKILKITLWGGKTIRATENHWFLNESNRFAPLSNFKIGDILIHQSGDVLPIEKIEEDGYEDVYNMHVKDHHTYIAEEILVHNGGGGKGGGQGGGGMMKGIIAIFLAVILAIIPGTQVFAGLTLSMMMPAILGLVAVGVSLMLSKPPPMVSPAAIANPSADFSGSPNGGGGEPSYLFNGPVNTVGEGGPVPVGYGRLIIGSHQVFASYDQYYRIQSRISHLEKSGPNINKPKRDAGEGSFPSKSYYFTTRGYPVKITNINNEDMSTTSLTS